MKIAVASTGNHVARHFALCERFHIYMVYGGKIMKETDFSTPEEMRTAFPNLDNFKYRNKWYVLDVGGNNLRVIAYINFVNKRFFVKHITNHAEYDKLTRYYRENKE